MGSDVYAVPLASNADLRPLEPWRAAEFLEHLDRARDHIAPWVGQSFVATDLTQAQAVLQRYADARARDEGGIAGIWLDGVLVGGVMFVSFHVAAGTCEVGCWLEPAAVGRGLITAAAGQLIDWAVRVRGIVRVEWQTLSANGPSIRVAQRLGMRRDGVLRNAVAPRPGNEGRADLEIWSVLAEEWLSGHEAEGKEGAEDRTQDEAFIDALTATFFAAFTNTGGASAPVDSIRDVCVAGAVIVKGGADQQIYDLDRFTEPRRQLLTSGDLIEFYEEEISGRTRIAGDIASRFSRYRKAGILRGEPFAQEGTKAFHFLRTPDGWRITAASWTDD